MRTLIFRCPASGLELDSGIRLDDRSHEVVENLPVFISCSTCRTTHTWRVKDGHYKDETAIEAPPLQPSLAAAVSALKPL